MTSAARAESRRSSRQRVVAHSHLGPNRASRRHRFVAPGRKKRIARFQWALREAAKTLGYPRRAMPKAHVVQEAAFGQMYG